MLADILAIVLHFGLQLMTLALLLRFILQAVRADFYNPISQMIVRVSDPVLRPMRRLIPGWGGLDLGALAAALLTEIVHISALATLALYGANPRAIYGYLSNDPLQVVAILSAGGLPIVAVVATASVWLLQWVLGIYLAALFGTVILSWIAPFSSHPGALLIRQITEPVLAPIRKRLPPMGGLDFSVMIAILIIYILEQAVIPRLLAGTF